MDGVTLDAVTIREADVLRLSVTEIVSRVELLRDCDDHIDGLQEYDPGIKDSDADVVAELRRVGDGFDAETLEE